MRQTLLSGVCLPKASLTLQLPCRTPRSSRVSVTHYTAGQSTLVRNPLGNPLKFTHSSTFSQTPPQSIHPLFNFPSQRQLTHSSTFPSYAGANKRATGKRQESPSPVCTIVSQVNTCILNQGCNRAMFRVPCPENCRFSFFGFGFFLGTIFDIYYAN